MQSFFEGIVLLLGPVLILLALGITTMLSYTFFDILVPMMLEKHEQSSFQWTWVGLHCTWVLFLLVNILFNYFMCVMTRNSGPKYDQVVRELADATGFVFPETPAEVEEYRLEYEDKMTLRIRRRREREMEKNQQQQQEGRTTSTSTSPNHGTVNGNHNNNSDVLLTSTVTTSDAGSSSTSMITHRKQPQPNATTVVNPAPTTTSVRRWMLMGPFEWGFCHNSKQPKPPRSHYDHVTKRLVLNLDHYCPWMFNSIGYFNYRYFVNFLVYVFLGMSYGALLTFEPFMLLQTVEYSTHSKHERAMRQHLPRPQPMIPHRDEKMLISLAFMICAAIGFAILILGGFHVFLVLTAQTTIEFHGNWSKWRRQGNKFRNPYSEGYRKNWRRIYGDQPWFLAVLPSAREPQYLPFPIPGKDTRRFAAASTKIEIIPGNNV
ncbi:hypothetical protein ACA910_000884 [Epithemia clementina (nom. ined.)]